MLKLKVNCRYLVLDELARPQYVYTTLTIRVCCFQNERSQGETCETPGTVQSGALDRRGVLDERQLRLHRTIGCGQGNLLPLQRVQGSDQRDDSGRRCRVHHPDTQCKLLAGKRSFHFCRISYESRINETDLTNKKRTSERQDKWRF